MSDQLLPEIIAKILARSELHTIIQSRCVSKQWRAIIDDPHFIKHQINHSIKTNTNYSLYLKEQDGDFYHLDLSTINACNSLQLCSNLPNILFGTLVGACNGLLCFRVQENEDVCIINPFTRKQWWVLGTLLANFHNSSASSSPNVNDVVWTGYGFGYDHVADDYKVVRIAEISHSRRSVNDDDDVDMGLLEYEMVICYVKTRVVRVLKIPYHTRTTQKMGVLVNGALHWVMGRNDDVSSPNLIVGYNLASCKFTEVAQPDFGDNGYRVDIGVFGVLLCVFAVDDMEMCTDVWVMEEYGVKESWKKLCSIPHIETCYDFVRSLSFWRRGSEVLLELDQSRIVWYDMEKKTVRDVMLQKLQRSCFETIICLRSLAPIPLNEDGEVVENR
ncbi:F-box protein CPR1-like [Mercurialis annua]|uniref:F-box protein CPR1-like n=1 Tax=Mercurialis annua TaxID=3986 RepID=UPI002160BC12|nr:F-box protein CPR1-like [Mercurialis annua]